MVWGIMGRKSKIESSPNFNVILDMIKEGLKPEDIEDYLKSKYDESISTRTIRRYVKKIRSKTNQKYFEKKKAEKSNTVKNTTVQNDDKFDEVVDKCVANKETLDSVVEKGVSDLEALDTIIEEANKLNLDISGIKPKYFENYCVNSEVEIEKLKIQAKRLAIQAVNTKAKILKDTDGEDKEFVLRIVSDEDERIEVEANKETES